MDHKKATSMDYCDTEALQLAIQFKMTDRRIKLQDTKLIHDVAQRLTVFPLRKMLLYEIKLLFTYIFHILKLCRVLLFK